MSGLRETVAGHCRALAGAELTHPWDDAHDAWKVGGRIFALVGARAEGVSVKCADVETAAMLIDVGVATRAPYLHRSWVLLPEGAAPDELAHRVAASYDIVRAKLPKAVRLTLEEAR